MPVIPADAEGSGVQGHLQLHSKFKANHGYRRPSLRQIIRLLMAMHQRASASLAKILKQVYYNVESKG